MSYISVLRKCVKYGGQTSKNVHDVRKVCLRKCLCVFVCLSEFYVSALPEIDVGRSLHIEEYV